MELAVGSIIEGKVTKITKYGAFVSLPNGKFGLVHISEISHAYVNQVSDYLQEGQQVKVKIIDIDQNNRINLSMKQAVDPPPAGNRRTSRSDGGFVSRSAPKEPTDFEDRLKQFMQSSDSKLSELRYLEKKGGNRRGNGRR